MSDAGQREAIRAKIDARPDFGPVCAQAFYGALFARYPSLEKLFPKDKPKEQMFGAMMSIITKSITDEAKLDEILGDLGRRHGSLGITSMHMKVGRGIFLDAVATACPRLDQRDLSYFGDMYDRIATAMFNTKPRAKG